jgi:hypothetical protein
VPPKSKKDSSIGRCERCDKIIVFTKFTLCYECRQDEKAEVGRVLEYLKLHRGATLNFIAEATGVDPQLVLKLIQGGHVEVAAKGSQKQLKRRT